MRWDGPVFSGLSEKKSDFVTCPTGPPGGLAPIPGHAAAHPGHAAAHPPPPAGVNWWICGRLLPHGPRSRPGCRDGLAVVYPRSRDAGGLVQAAGRRETPCHQSTPNIYLWADLCRYIYMSVHTPCLPIYIPFPSSQPTRDLPGGLDPAPCLPAGPPVLTPAPPPGRGRHAPGDSPHPSAPTGQFPCCVTPNTRRRLVNPPAA